MDGRESRCRRFEIANIVLDLDRHAVFIDEKEVHFTLTEFRLLEVLLPAAKGGRCIPHKQLENIVADIERKTEDRDIYHALYSHLKRMRHKFRNADAGVRIISHYGLGIELLIIIV